MSKKRNQNNGKSKKALALGGIGQTINSISHKKPLDCQFFPGIPDSAHQFGLNDKSSRLEVILGMDFGTSSTKVVLHVPNYPGSPAYALPFGELGHESLKYLLPTRLYVTQDGQCRILPEADAAILTEMKICLMKAPRGVVAPASGTSRNLSAEVATTAYLANVLRYARCWFLSNKREAFGDHVISWSWNLGLPAAIDDDPALRENFDTVGRASWVLSRRSGPITNQSAQQAISDIRYQRITQEEEPFEFSLVPEVIAEVSGYARSPLRNQGLHLLLDIGASTLDVCSFNIAKENGDDYFPIYTADVELLGSHRLHAARVEGAMGAVKTQANKSVDVSDPLAVLPDDFECYVPPHDLLMNSAEYAQEQFIASCDRFVSKTLADLKKKRDPYSDRWRGQLPIFFCGGASASPVYGEVVQRIDEWLMRNHRESEGARLIELPKPESLDADINNADYHRLAVAWGLSHSIENIGSYDRPSEIDDIPPAPRRTYEDNYPSKEWT